MLELDLVSVCLSGQDNEFDLQLPGVAVGIIVYPDLSLRCRSFSEAGGHRIGFHVM